jgi:hypothetical protein
MYAAFRLDPPRTRTKTKGTLTRALCHVIVSLRDYKLQP